METEELPFLFVAESGRKQRREKLHFFDIA